MCSGYQGWCSFCSPRSGSYHAGNVDSNTFLWKFSSNETISCDNIRAKLRFEIDCKFHTYRCNAPTKWKYASWIREYFVRKNKMSVVTKTRYQGGWRCKQVESFEIPDTPSCNHPRPANCLVLCWPRSSFPAEIWIFLGNFSIWIPEYQRFSTIYKIFDKLDKCINKTVVKYYYK